MEIETARDKPARLLDLSQTTLDFKGFDDDGLNVLSSFTEGASSAGVHLSIRLTSPVHKIGMDFGVARIEDLQAGGTRLSDSLIDGLLTNPESFRISSTQKGVFTTYDEDDESICAMEFSMGGVPGVHRFQGMYSPHSLIHRVTMDLGQSELVELVDDIIRENSNS